MHRPERGRGRSPNRTTDFWSLSFTPDGSALAAGTTHSLSLHGLTATHQQQVAPVVMPARAMAFSPDGSRVAVAAAGTELRILDTRDLSTLATFAAYSGGREELRFTPDGSTLLMATRYVPVAAWERGTPADPERRFLSVLAHNLVARLFLELGELSARVIERLESDETLDDPVRRAAIATALSRGDNPNRIINVAAIGLRDPDLPPERFAWLAERAAVGAETAPRSAWAWSTLAVAEYRTGRFEQAIFAAGRAMDLAKEHMPDGFATDWAVIAMASHRLGRTEEAQEAWRKVNADDQRTRLSRFDLALLAEAHELLSGG